MNHELDCLDTYEAVVVVSTAGAVVAALVEDAYALSLCKVA